MIPGMSEQSLPFNLYSRRELQAPFVVDVVLLAVTLVLVGMSILMVYSTTGVAAQEKFGDAMLYVRRQGVAALVGLILMSLCALIDTGRLRKLSPWFLIFSLIFLALPFIPGLGIAAGGARRWIYVAGFRFQPGEFVKLFVVLYFAGFFWRHENRLATFAQGVLKPLLLLSVFGAGFLMQPDFGSAAIVALVTLCMASVVGVRLRWIFLGGAALSASMAAAIWLSPYRMSRVLSFLSPWSDASGRGYQLIQSLIAVGSGQLSGVGLGGSQQKLFFLPAAHTDFIFAVIGEELGFVGCIAVLFLFILFLWRGFVLAEKLADDSFAFALAVGLTLLIFLPAVLNVGVVTGLLPTKGLVLPLIGYGGSSLVSALAAVGLLLGLGRSHLKKSA